MQNQTFLLTNYSIFSIRNTRIGLISLGTIIIGFSLAEMISSAKAIPSNPFLIIMAVNFLLIGIVGLSKKSRFSPKFRITNDQIIFKDKIFAGERSVKWNSLSKIELGSYKVTFYKPNKKFTFNLDTTKENSITIKTSLREAANLKGVEISGS